MATALITHPACLQHDNGTGHPESIDRLQAVLEAMNRPEYEALRRLEAPRASLEHIARVHDRAYIDHVLSMVPASGISAFDAETNLSPLSGEAALRAAGALCLAVDAVMGQAGGAVDIDRAFCAVRPPGHHAAVPPGSGFCLFNNIAIGAAHALTAHGLNRVAIVDFDVHHGNGTQGWAERQEKMLFISSHQYPLWPGSGLADETGSFNNILNVPLPPGTNGPAFRRAMESQALPRLNRFEPEMILISAGFDAHAMDPLAHMRLEADDFGWITRELCAIADRYGRGRVISTLEGGYDLEALVESVGAHVRAMIRK